MTNDDVVRQYTFAYSLSPEEEPGTVEPTLIPSRVSRLRKVTEWDGSGAHHLPPMTFSYGGFHPGTAGTVEIDHPAAWVPSVGLHNGVDLFDVDGDGLPDLLNGSLSGDWRHARNLGGESFQTPRPMQNSPAVPLSSSTVQIMDFNADGYADYASKSGTSPTEFYDYQLYEGNGRWGAPRRFENNPPFAYNDPELALLDLDFDKDIDVMSFNSSGLTMFYQQDGKWTEETRSWFHPDMADVSHNLRLSRAHTRLVDLNGDRLQDLVEMNLASARLQIRYWPTMGRGKFGPARMMDDLVFPYFELGNLYFLDVNGDGLSDLTRLHPSHELEVWLNRGDGGWSDPFSVPRPSYDPTRTAVRVADMNANGSVDLVFFDSFTGDIAYVDFSLGLTAPNQLRIVDNGLGKRTEIQYRTVSSFQREAEEAGRPWSLHLPFSMTVVSGYDIGIGLDLDGHAGPDRMVIRIRYRDPFYDARRKEFRGFSFVEKTEHGDEFFGVEDGAAPGRVTRIAYHPGAPDGVDNDGDGDVDELHGDRYEEHALKGNILWTEVTDVGVTGAEHWPYGPESFLPDPQVYSRVHYDMEVRTLYGGPGALLPLNTQDDGEACRLGIVTRTIGERVEKGAGPKRTVETRHDYDAYGNKILEEELGVTTPGVELGDQRETISEYRFDEEGWIMDRPERILVRDGDGAWVKETRYRYDERGRLTDTIAYLDPDTPETVASVEYDTYGNAVKRTDARGFSVTNTFDPQFHTYAVTETVEVGGGQPDLSMSFEYDPGRGNLLRFNDANGHERSYQYDRFGRLVAVFQPLDAPDRPSRTFRYTLCDDLRGWTYAYNEAGDLTLGTGDEPGTIVSTLETFQREKIGGDGTVHRILHIDGMGRKLSTWTEDEGGYTVTESSFYNTRRAMRINYMPHAANGSFLADTTAPATEMRFDAMQRVVETRLPPDPDGVRHVARTEYQPLRTVSYDYEDTVAGGRHEDTPTITETDGLGRRIRLVEHNQQGAAPGPITTSYTYDTQNNLVEIVDAHGNRKESRFDAWGRKTADLDPNAGRVDFEYDLTGNLTRQTDARGRTVVYTYDGIGRLLTVDLDGNGEKEIQYGYDAPAAAYPHFTNLKGRLAWVEDESGARYVSHDSRGNLNQSVRRVMRRDGRLEDYRFESRHDAMGRVYEAVYPDGDRLTYEFNARGLLASIPGIVQSIDYNHAGQRVSMVCANGVASTYGYDDRQRLRTLRTQSPVEGDLQDLTYTLDGANNMLAMTDGRALAADSPRNMTQTFEMDDLYRLTHVNGAGYGTIDWTHDKIGNMLSVQSSINDPRVAHGQRHFAGGRFHRGPRGAGDVPGPHALTSTDSGYNVTYDASGNMLTSRGNTYTWDALGRLASVNSDTGTLRFVYDDSGGRVLKYLEETPGDETVYLNSTYELRADKAVKYVFAGPVRVARVEGPLPVPDQVTQRDVLRAGWNLVGLRVVPDSAEPGQVLASIAGRYTAVHHPKGEGDYASFTPGGSANTFTELKPGEAYWILATEPCTLEIHGQAHQPADTALEPGWQGITLGGQGPQNFSDLFAQSSPLTSLRVYDPVHKDFLKFTRDAPTFLQTVQRGGSGLPVMVHSAQATTLTFQQSQEEVFFYHPDHLGSGNVVTDAVGQVVEELYYYPFGLLRYRHTPRGELYKSEYTFSGKELDESSQLFYFGARYYDPILCVFVSVDPVALHSPEATLSNSLRLNAYIYSGNNPLVLVDPDGRFWSEIISAVSAVVSIYFPPAAYIGGALSGAVGAIENGGGLQDAFFGALRGGLSGYISAGTAQFAQGATSALGLEALGSTAVDMFERGLTSYLSTGVNSTLQGQGWQHASFSSLLNSELRAGVVSEFESAQSSQSSPGKGPISGTKVEKQPPRFAFLLDGNRMSDTMTLEMETLYGALKGGSAGRPWSNGLQGGNGISVETMSYESFTKKYQLPKETNIFPGAQYHKDVEAIQLRDVNREMLGAPAVNSPSTSDSRPGGALGGGGGYKIQMFNQL